MGLFDKVKDFFYEDVEDTEETVREKEPFFKKKEKSVEKPREEIRTEREEKKIEEKTRSVIDDDVSEVELFKSERTFNFPMDIDDDDVFEIKNNREEKKEEPRKIENTNSYSRTTLKTFDSYSGISRATLTSPTSSNKSTTDNTKFKPSPVISPVYGILDKNYTVDDVVDKNLSKTKEFNVDKKIVDFDTVRNRAYKDLDEEIERTLTEKKDIFFNLDEDESKEEKEESDDTNFINDNDFDNNDVIITFDSEEDESKDDTDVPDEEVPILKRKRKSKAEEIPEEKTAEKEDLFNLIDNMYKDEEEEDE